MIERSMVSGTHYGDETDGYDISFDKPYTVKEFIADILSTYQREWGGIRIRDGRTNEIVSSCGYRYGELTSEIRSDIMDKQIERAVGRGGWSCMDYVLYLEAPYLESKCESRK